MSATTSTSSAREAGDPMIRPFRISVPEEDLVELRRRIVATRFPEKETVADASQGVRLATMQALVRYWGTDHDLRRFERRLNALPQFATEIDGLDIASCTSGRGTRTHCRSSSPTAGPARSSKC